MEQQIMEMKSKVYDLMIERNQLIGAVQEKERQIGELDRAIEAAQAEKGA